ncbi:HAD family phosphatase [Bradyrhizobium manausense]|uniref:HAD family hydrolase n=1 Tax=Bradyrhizobium TaxID=374 RepID=UPI001BA8C275|nr:MULTISPECIES: HAD family phosphatase [Bradyrhizobium]MBR0829660.1 HAD family phosphatase [Bradyrhizobium manausense]UVO25282.1 HAD family phosphatase [Bradyrhizobium arachidis]
MADAGFAAAGQIKLVLFDMDNVLCRYDRGVRAAHLARLAGSTTDHVYEAIWGSGFEFLGDDGSLDACDYLRGFGERLNYPLSVGEWLEARRHSMTPDTAVLDIVGEISRSVDVAVLTNNTTLVADHIDVLFPQLRPLFGDRIFASAQFKVGKPDPDCFRACLSQLQVPPSAVLFVDDLPANVAGAREAGLFAHHHTTAEALRQALRQQGIV